MSTRNGVRRYVLVPQSEAAEPGGPGVRRYRLAHLGASRRGALGEDRHERLERAAGLAGGPPANGAAPNGSASAPAAGPASGEAGRAHRRDRLPSPGERGDPLDPAPRPPSRPSAS